ncbi:hypothetical protein BpHYR1_029309 [Brachionus plicatilis]|uniref:Uncharacterized protein n=1 Tax=Brachionus plicatilis TaxID=10195 RepID=A0A3M7PBS5_BRAPC|nr:hypothetical protein BpHYR1_029309 [Brachionus plicatilis]
MNLLNSLRRYKPHLLLHPPIHLTTIHLTTENFFLLGLASTTIPGPEADLCLRENDDVDLPEDVFDPADFELGELVTPPPPQDEQPIAEIMRKADTLYDTLLPIPDVDRGL